MSAVSIKCRSCTILPSLPSSTLIPLQTPTDPTALCTVVQSMLLSASKGSALLNWLTSPTTHNSCPALLAPTPFACHAELLGIGETDLVCGLTCVNPGIMWQGLEFGEVERALAKPRGATWQNIITSFMKPQPKTQACDPPQPCRLATCPGSCPIEVVWTTRR